MRKLFLSSICLLLSFSVRSEQKDLLSISFDIKEVMNMHGSADLINSLGEIIHQISLIDESLLIEEIFVCKENGVFVASQLDLQLLKFNSSLSQIQYLQEELIYYRKRKRRNAVSWENKNLPKKYAQTKIAKDKIIISIDNIDNEALLAMILMERIHHARSLLIANTTFF